MEYSESYEQKLLYTIIEKLDEIQEILIKKKRPFLGLEEAANYLGISKNTLYQYTSKNNIPYYKLRGRKIYFKIEDLDNFILNHRNRCSSNEEIEEKTGNYVVRKGKKFSF
jgi:excisionase family DNA binding protein